MPFESKSNIVEFFLHSISDALASRASVPDSFQQGKTRSDYLPEHRSVVSPLAFTHKQMLYELNRQIRTCSNTCREEVEGLEPRNDSSGRCYGLRSWCPSEAKLCSVCSDGALLLENHAFMESTAKCLECITRKMEGDRNKCKCQEEWDTTDFANDVPCERYGLRATLYVWHGIWIVNGTGGRSDGTIRANFDFLAYEWYAGSCGDRRGEAG
jgi:hypothetical protein